MSDQKTIFQKLSPTSEAKIGAYKDALDYIFQQDDLRNIGLTGALGAGKSSIIKTYEKLNETNRKFLYVSLAHFEDVNEGKPQPEDSTAHKGNKNDVAILEGKIINQLIHQVDVDSIPKTRFRIKRQNPAEFIVGFTISVVLFIVAIIYLVFFNNWAQIVISLDSPVLKSLLDFTARKSTLVFDIALLIGLFSYGLYKFFLLQKDRQIIKKLSYKGNDIEIFSDCEESYFDKYLNDVLYIFECCKVDAVIFEDIDRYKCVMIFQRLREINELVNRRLRQQKLIRFFYLMRDDIFKSTDRTKFFDFILPIVPVVDSSNSYDLLHSHFERTGHINQFNAGFLKSISIYIEDMRILKNICNEFSVYLSCIEEIKPDFNKLLSLVIYKNLFPQDFYLLQQNISYINFIMSKRNQLIAMKTDALNKTIQDNLIMIKAMEKEYLASVAEIDAAFKVLKSAPTGRILTEHKEEYDTRVQLLKRRQDGDVEKLKNKNLQLEEDINRASQLRMSDLACVDDTIFEVDSNVGKKYDSVISSKYFGLLKYLVRNNYIDFNYHDYITYFYPNRISFSDKAFLMNVLDLFEPNYTYEINSPHLVTEWLTINDFKHGSILNFSLLSYLLETYSENHEKLDAFLSVVSEQKNIEFLNNFHSSPNNKHTSELPSRLYLLWPDYISELINSSSIPIELRNSIVLEHIKHLKIDHLKNINKNSVLSDYTCTQINNFIVDNVTAEKLITALKTFKIKIPEIDFSTIDMTLWSGIYKHNLYELNKENIFLILKEVYNLSISNDFIHHCLSLILSKPEEPIAKYAVDEIDVIIKVVLDSCEKTITDNEDTIKTILNNQSIEIETRLSYLACIRTSITSLASIQELTFWPIILDNNLINIDSQDILLYFFNSGAGLDEHLINAINKTQKEFLKTKEDINTTYDNGAVAFFEAVLKCNTLSDAKYIEILKAINFYESDFAIETISLKKAELLIKEYIIQMDTITLENIRNNYKKLLALFIESNIDEYYSLVYEQTLNLHELKMILTMGRVHYRKRLAFLQLTAEPISIKHAEYTSSIEVNILKNNFDINDLSYLLQHFNSLKQETKRALVSIVNNHLELIVTQSMIMRAELLLILLEKQTISLQVKYNLYANNLLNITFEQSINCLKLLKDNSLLEIFNGKRPLVQQTDENKKILNAMRKRGWINSFSSKPNGYYRVNGCKKKYLLT